MGSVAPASLAAAKIICVPIVCMSLLSDRRMLDDDEVVLSSWEGVACSVDGRCTDDEDEWSIGKVPRTRVPRTAKVPRFCGTRGTRGIRGIVAVLSRYFFFHFA
eukprot:scaffold37950_cov40-Cyclotella_meneghiniana.AAC.1